jgi:hypothetical protein
MSIAYNGQNVLWPNEQQQQWLIPPSSRQGGQRRPHMTVSVRFRAPGGLRIQVSCGSEAPTTMRPSTAVRDLMGWGDRVDENRHRDGFMAFHELSYRSSEIMAYRVDPSSGVNRHEVDGKSWKGGCDILPLLTMRLILVQSSK